MVQFREQEANFAAGKIFTYVEVEQSSSEFFGESLPEPSFSKPFWQELLMDEQECDEEVRLLLDLVSHVEELNGPASQVNLLSSCIFKLMGYTNEHRIEHCAFPMTVEYTEDQIISDMALVDRPNKCIPLLIQVSKQKNFSRAHSSAERAAPLPQLVAICVAAYRRCIYLHRYSKYFPRIMVSNIL
jgi:hypothetical protein